MIYVTRKEHFNAAHKLWKPEWSDEKNIAVFGKCANKNWHGHNYELFITVKGEPSAETGFVVDLKQLSTLIKNEIVEQQPRVTTDRRATTDQFNSAQKSIAQKIQGDS